MAVSGRSDVGSYWKPGCVLSSPKRQTGLPGFCLVAMLGGGSGLTLLSVAHMGKYLHASLLQGLNHHNYEPPFCTES